MMSHRFDMGTTCGLWISLCVALNSWNNNELNSLSAAILDIFFGHTPNKLRVIADNFFSIFD